MRRFFSRNGRSSRLEWWIIDLLVLVGFHFSHLLLPFRPDVDGVGADGAGLRLPAQLWLPVAALLLWLSVASIVRRLHDRGKSGWWSLAYLIPGIGQLWCIVECGFLPGQPGTNRYGPPPARAANGHAILTALLSQSLVLRFVAFLILRQHKAQQRAQSGQHAQSGQRAKTGQGAAPRAAAPLARNSVGAVTRIEPRRRNLAAAAIIVVAIVLGVATVFFSNFGTYAVVTPAPINPDVPVFGGDKAKLP